MFPSYSQYGELDALADDLEYRAALARQQAALQRGVAPQPPRVRRAHPRPHMRPAPVPRYIPRPEVEPYDYGYQMEEAPYEYAYTPTPARYPVTAAAPAYEPYSVPPVYQAAYGRSRPTPRAAAAYELKDAMPAYERSRQAPSYPEYYEDEDAGEDYGDVPPPLIPLSARAVVPRRQPVPRSPVPREAPVLRQRQPAPRRVSFEPSYEEEEEEAQRPPARARPDNASPNTVQDIASILGQLLGGARQAQPQQQAQRRPEPSPAQPSIADVLGQAIRSVVQQIQQPQQPPQVPQAPRTRAASHQDVVARAAQGFRDALAQRSHAAPPTTRPAEESPMTWADYLGPSCGQWQPKPAQHQRAAPQTAPSPAPATRQSPPAPTAEPEEAQAPSLQDFLANIIHAVAQQSQQQQQQDPVSQSQSDLPPSLMRSAQPQYPTRAPSQPQAQPAQQKQQTSSAPTSAPAPVEPKTSYTYAAPASAQPAAIPHSKLHSSAPSSSPALPIPGRAYQHIPHNLRDLAAQAQAQAQGIRKAGVADEVADIKEAIRRSLADRAGVEEVHGPQQAPSAASPAAAVNANAHADNGHVNSHPHNSSTATAATSSSPSSAKKSSIEGAVTTDSRAPTEPVHEGSESPTPASAAAAHLAQIAKIEERFVNLSYDFNFPTAPEFSPSASASASSTSSPTSASASARAPSLAYTHVNQPIRAYELALTGLLTDLDAVESAGDEEVRHARKELVERIEGALEALERQKDEAWAKVSVASSPVSAAAPPVVLEPQAEVARADSKEDAVSQPASEDVVEQQAAASDEGYVIASEPEPEAVVVEDANATTVVADATDVDTSEPAKVVSDPEFVSPAPLLHDSEDVMLTQAQPLPASQLQSVASESSAAAASPDNRVTAAIPALDENPAGTPSEAHEDVDVTVSTLAEIDEPAVSYAAVAAGATPSTSIGTADSASSSSSSYPPVPPTSPSASVNPAKDSFHDEPSAQTPYVNEEPEEEEPQHVIDSLGSSPVDIPSELDSDFDEEAPRPIADNSVQKEKEPEVIPPSMEEAAEVESKTEFVML